MKADLLCAQFSATQHGAFTHEQARDAGHSDATIYRRLGAGAWIALHPRVYVDAAVPPSWEGRLMAACLWAGHGACASHRSAAQLHSLERAGGDRVEISSRGRLRDQERVLIHTSSMLTPEVITDVRGIPATTVERTLLDLCSVGRRWSVEAALDGAIRTGKTSLDAIGDRFVREARKGRRGIQLMRLMLTERGLGEAISDSGLHSEFVRFLRKHSITGFDQFYPVRDETGFYVEIDVAFPEKMLGFEVDGYSAHGGKQAFDHDRERERKLILRGWRIVRITKADLKKPHELIQDIRALLRDR